MDLSLDLVVFNLFSKVHERVGNRCTYVCIHRIVIIYIQWNLTIKTAYGTGQTDLNCEVVIIQKSNYNKVQGYH